MAPKAKAKKKTAPTGLKKTPAPGALRKQVQKRAVPDPDTLRKQMLKRTAAFKDAATVQADLRAGNEMIRAVAARERGDAFIPWNMRQMGPAAGTPGAPGTPVVISGTTPFAAGPPAPATPMRVR